MINKEQAQKMGFNIIDSTKENNPLKSMLERNFPDTLSEGQVSLKAIATLLGINADSNTQGYELNFTGKALANTLYTTPVEYELSEEVEQSKERESTQNSIIIGDNLDVLKILKSAYYEKIKMIYIDPPYNTKNDNFIYPDDFRQDYKRILHEVGLLEMDEEGNEVESKTLQTFRNITGSKSHSGWLSFMLPRLKLARDLLREDGVIFISIDDNEQANLKILCDEIFGEENFVSCFIWQKKSGGGQARYFYEGHEYLLIYCKDKTLLSGLYKTHQSRGIESDIVRKMHGKYTNNADLKKLYEKYPHQLVEHRNLMFEELDIFLQEKRIGKKKYEEIQGKLRSGEYFLKPFNENFHLICRQSQDDSSLMYSILNGVYNSDGNNEIEEIFDGQLAFSNPKPSGFLKQFLGRNTQDSDLILDFFAGSGTTAQAVMELNAEDGGNRKFILVQLPEKIKEDKNKTAYDFVKNELGKSEPKISDITIERVRRAGDKLRNEKGATSNVDIGYRVYSLCEKARLSDDKSIIPHSATITPQDIARNLALFAGKPLHSPLEEIVEGKLFVCEDIFCVVEFDKEVESKILEDNNKAIFIDGYGTHSLESFLNLNIPNNELVSVVY